jgi:hypothetical protein
VSSADTEIRLLPVGTRIKFIKSLYSGPTGDCPAFVYAEKGDTSRPSIK